MLASFRSMLKSASIHLLCVSPLPSSYRLIRCRLYFHPDCSQSSSIDRRTDSSAHLITIHHTTSHLCVLQRDTTHQPSSSIIEKSTLVYHTTLFVYLSLSLSRSSPFVVCRFRFNRGLVIWTCRIHLISSHRIDQTRRNRNHDIPHRTPHTHHIHRAHIVIYDRYVILFLIFFTFRPSRSC